jgi:short-subunit dehydrogenase
VTNPADLSGQVALVTGGGRGIGRQITLELGARGVAVALVARTVEQLDEVAAEVEEAGGQALVAPGDVTDRLAVEAIVARVEGELGPIDLLVNNAGIEQSSAFHETPIADLERIIAINLVAPMRLSRLVLPGMLERRRGHVVCIASLAGKFGPAFQVAYGASKAGLIEFSHALRSEYLGTGVSASVVCPGFIREAGMYQRTLERTPGARPSPLLGTSTPQAVAKAVVRVVKRDLAEVAVSPGPSRLTFAFGQLFPNLAVRVARSLTNDVFRKDAESRRREAGRQ